MIVLQASCTQHFAFVVFIIVFIIVFVIVFVVVAATDTKRAINSQNTLEGPKSSAHKGIYAESNTILVLLATQG